MKKILVVWLALCVLLTGCGTSALKENRSQETASDKYEQSASDKDRENNKTEIKWVMNEITLPDARSTLQALAPEEGSAFIELTDVAGGNVYNFASLHSGADDYKCVGYCIQKLASPYENWECYQVGLDEWSAGEECFPTTYQNKPYVTEDGTIHIILKGEENFYLCQWQETKGASGRKIDAESKLHEVLELGVDVWYEDDNGKVYVAAGDAFYCFDELLSEKQIADTAPEGYVFQISRNPFSQELFFMGASADSVVSMEEGTAIHDGGFSVWQADAKTPVYVAEIMEDTASEEMAAFMSMEDCVVFSSETEGFLCNATGIWEFSIEESQRTRIYDYETDGITYNDSKKPINTWASYRENGSLLVLTYTVGGEYRLCELKKEDAGQNSDKEIVELALTMESEFLKKIIVGFNKQSDKYQVVMRTPGSGEDWNDYRTGIQAELSAGNGPDLLADVVLDMETCAKRGYLEDLTEEFVSYEELIMPSVWALGQVDGHCYGIFYDCSIKTLVGSRDIIGERESWTLQEAMECARISGAQAFTYDFDISPTTLFFYMGFMTGTNRNLIDWENRTCHFDSREAMELLEFAAEYGNPDCEYEEVYSKIKEGELLTRVLYLMSPDDMQQAANLLDNNDIYVGFPTEDGGSGHIISGTGLSVNKFSSAREGAVEFLKYLLSEEVQSMMVEEFVDSHYGFGFPVREASMEQVYEFLQSKPENSERVAFTEEQIKTLRTIFETARPGKGDSAASIITVVEEELPFYFSGQRSAKEVLDIVQNRAQLYMEESE